MSANHRLGRDVRRARAGWAVAIGVPLAVWLVNGVGVRGARAPERDGTASAPRPRLTPVADVQRLAALPAWVIGSPVPKVRVLAIVPSHGAAGDRIGLALLDVVSTFGGDVGARLIVSDRRRQTDSLQALDPCVDGELPFSPVMATIRTAWRADCRASTAFVLPQGAPQVATAARALDWNDVVLLVEDELLVGPVEPRLVMARVKARLADGRRDVAGR